MPLKIQVFEFELHTPWRDTVDPWANGLVEGLIPGGLCPARNRRLSAPSILLIQIDGNFANHETAVGGKRDEYTQLGSGRSQCSILSERWCDANHKRRGGCMKVGEPPPENGIPQ